MEGKKVEVGRGRGDETMGMGLKRVCSRNRKQQKERARARITGEMTLMGWVDWPFLGRGLDVWTT